LPVTPVSPLKYVTAEQIFVYILISLDTYVITEQLSVCFISIAQSKIVHQDAKKQCDGRYWNICGGNTTKILMAVDAHGLTIDFEITGGEVHDCKIAPKFIEKLPVRMKAIIGRRCEMPFARIKHFRGFSTRFDKLKRNYVSVVAMACALLWLMM
jgi:hypothetical protein